MSDDGQQSACTVIPAHEPYLGNQVPTAETIGAKALYMQLITMPPGTGGKRTKHATHPQSMC